MLSPVHATTPHPIAMSRSRLTLRSKTYIDTVRIGLLYYVSRYMQSGVYVYNSFHRPMFSSCYFYEYLKKNKNSYKPETLYFYKFYPLFNTLLDF